MVNSEAHGQYFFYCFCFNVRSFLHNSHTLEAFVECNFLGVIRILSAHDDEAMSNFGNAYFKSLQLCF